MDVTLQKSFTNRLVLELSMGAQNKVDSEGMLQNSSSEAVPCSKRNARRSEHDVLLLASEHWQQPGGNLSMKK